MHYNLVVIGAGIQGAGVAQAAAAAGYSVLVIEKSKPAAGTSSKSSKLIHGGLRYLESAQFSLVAESLHERALLLKLAPDLVKLQQLHIPIYKDSKRNPLTIRAGLSLYALLARLDKNSRFRSLPKSEWDTCVGLEKENLQGIFAYCEAQTDDAALTRAVLHSAVKMGAKLAMPANFLSAEIQSDKTVIHYEASNNKTNDQKTNDHKTTSVTSDILVNCAGPWTQSVTDKIVLRKMQSENKLPAVDLVKGSHLLLPPLLNQYFYLEAPQDKRAVFVLPYKNQLMIGTTEKVFDGLPDDVACSQEEKEYLLKVLLHYFPKLKIDAATIDSFAGLRVLPRSEKSAFSRPREVMLELDDQVNPRVLTLMGGKLTTYRATAEMALNKIFFNLPKKTPIAKTSEIYLEDVDSISPS